MSDDEDAEFNPVLHQPLLVELVIENEALAEKLCADFEKELMVYGTPDMRESDIHTHHLTNAQRRMDIAVRDVKQDVKTMGGGELERSTSVDLVSLVDMLRKDRAVFYNANLTDMWQLQPEILQDLEQGRIVVVTNYMFQNLYTFHSRHINSAWLTECLQGFVVPHQVYVVCNAQQNDTAPRTPSPFEIMFHRAVVRKCTPQTAPVFPIVVKYVAPKSTKSVAGELARDILEKRGVYYGFVYSPNGERLILEERYKAYMPRVDAVRWLYFNDSEEQAVLFADAVRRYMAGDDVDEGDVDKEDIDEEEDDVSLGVEGTAIAHATLDGQPPGLGVGLTELELRVMSGQYDPAAETILKTMSEWELYALLTFGLIVVVVLLWTTL